MNSQEWLKIDQALEPLRAGERYVNVPAPALWHDRYNRQLWHWRVMVGMSIGGRGQ